MNFRYLIASLFLICFTLPSLESDAQIRVRKRRGIRKTVVVTPRSRIVYIHPRRSRTIRVLTGGAIVIRNKRRSLHFGNGFFYRPYSGQYLIVRPPLGLRITSLPIGYRRIVFGSTPYYYSAGTFYTASGGGYIVASPPVGIVVNSLPDEADEVRIDGIDLYELNGVLYKKVKTTQENTYEVTGETEHKTDKKRNRKL